MKAPKGTKCIRVDWLGAEILIAFTKKQHRKIVKALHQEGNEDYSLECAGAASCWATHKKQRWYWLFLPDEESIVHECNHMTHMLMDGHGIPVSIDNTEVMAYLADYLIREVREVFRDRRLKLEHAE